uniref:Dissimilatory sulfite reductase alpha subunit n=1 Tax=sulfate-reducing bacterium AK-01 TaxID=96506 RepID=Q93TS8_9DELT|nr:dissimilatory sulfite reductase alpha subunit [sulfate-reducing bacterium AK-01]
MHWKHGGIVGVFGYGGGVIGRYCDQPEMFPGVAHFHTIRVNQPAGKFYNTEWLRNLCDLWEFRGSGITNMHGSTGDIVFLGTVTEQLEEIFFELTHKHGQDLGGSGSNLRTPSDCIGEARCEYACYDTQALCHFLTNEYQDNCTARLSRTSSSSSLTAAPTAAWLPLPVPTCPSSEPGATTSALIRMRSPLTLAANIRPTPALTKTATGEHLTSRRKSSTCAHRLHEVQAASWKSTTKSAPAACIASTLSSRSEKSLDTGVSILVGAKAPILTLNGSLLVLRQWKTYKSRIQLLGLWMEEAKRSVWPTDQRRLPGNAGRRRYRSCSATRQRTSLQPLHLLEGRRSSRRLAA